MSFNRRWALLALCLMGLVPNSLQAQEKKTEPATEAPAQKAAGDAKAGEAAQAEEGDWGILSGQIFVDGKVAVQPQEKVDSHPDKEVCKVDGVVPPDDNIVCLLYTSPSPRDQRGSRMPSSA